MMHNPKHYYRPKTLDEAIKLANQPGTLAIAGGALVFGTLELAYEAIVDLQDVAELKKIELRGDSVSVGGAATLQQVIESPLVPDVLKRSVTRTIPLNNRNGTSVAESVIVSDPPREWFAALVAWDVGVEQILPNGQQVIDGLASLLKGTTDQTLRSGIISRLDIPILGEREAVGTAFVARTPSDMPIVNAAVYVMLDDDSKIEKAFAGLGGVSTLVASISLEPLYFQSLSDTAIADTATWLMTQVEPVGDYLGSADYRREMTRVTVQRALNECREQLGL
jgi:CO/xanthine dehydrogenase FAD-binding subunit